MEKNMQDDLTDLTNINQPINFTVKDLYNLRAHFGHKISQWHPKMSPYICSIQNHMHIIDLEKTYGLLHKAISFLSSVIKNKGKILFVGTREEVKDVVAEYAQYCGQFYVNYRWMGGMLTNWPVVSKSIATLSRMEKLTSSNDVNSKYTKKERLSLERAKNKLLLSLGGINKMKKAPDALIVLDTVKDKTAILEANKLNIPVIAIVDTNTDPSKIQYPIPSNDDSIKCMKFYMQILSSCILCSMQNSMNSIKSDKNQVK